MSARTASIHDRRPRHIKVTGPGQTFRYESCEYPDCVVTQAGVGSLGERTACPSCGSGGANLTQVEVELGAAPWTIRLHCTCGNFWNPKLARPVTLRLATPERLDR